MVKNIPHITCTVNLHMVMSSVNYQPSSLFPCSEFQVWIHLNKEGSTKFQDNDDLYNGLSTLFPLKTRALMSAFILLPSSYKKL